MTSHISAKAAIADGNGQFSIQTISIAQPKVDEVLVEIKASGVCHTDFDSMSWGKPLVMGHEGAGIIIAIGDKVDGLSPGDRVLLNWAIPCGRCFQCTNGEQSICEANYPGVEAPEIPGHAHLAGTRCAGHSIERSFRLGTMATHALVHKNAVVKIPVDIPFSSACIIGCGVMTGYGSVVNAARVQPGSSVAVLGAGGVGLNVIQGARIAGAGKIIAIDIMQSKLDLARQFGATDTVLASADDANLLKAAEAVKTRTDNRGADYAFECTAIPELGAAPLAMVRNGGTAVQVSGVEQVISVDMQLFEWDKTYINPLYGKCRPQIDLPILMQLYASGQLLLDELVTATYSLNDLQQAFDDMHHGRNAKGVLIMDASL